MAPGTVVPHKLPLTLITENLAKHEGLVNGRGGGGGSCGVSTDGSPSPSDEESLECNAVGVSRDVSPSSEEDGVGEGFYEKWRRRLGYGQRGNDASTQTEYDPIVAEARAIFLDLFHLVKTENEEEEVGGRRQNSSSRGSSIRSRASRTMWRVASELLVKHSIVYKSIVDKLDLSSSEPDYSAFRIMCDEVFQGGHVSWGRIIVLYALFIQVARECHRNGRNYSAWAIADFVGLYIGETVSEWIAEEGGWVQNEEKLERVLETGKVAQSLKIALEEAFPSNDVMEQTVWKGLLVTGIGLGVLATAIKAIR